MTGVVGSSTTEFAVLDGELKSAAEAFIPATDDGFLRGDGVFEVFKVYAGRPFGLEQHIQRLLRSAAGIMLPEIDTRAIEADVMTLIEARGETDFGVRVVVTRGGHRLVLSEQIVSYPPSVRLALVEYQSTIVLGGLKTLSYAGNVLANRIAQERGYDEALLITPNDEVLEAPTATLFWSADGETLITPPLEEGILASITRAVLLEEFDVEQRRTSRADVLSAKEAFLCSSVREIQAVGEIDGHRMGVPGRLTELATKALHQHVEARLAAAPAK
jgi:branched-chain amino acid aminotransferase